MVVDIYAEGDDDARDLQTIEEIARKAIASLTTNNTRQMTESDILGRIALITARHNPDFSTTLEGVETMDLELRQIESLLGGRLVEPPDTGLGWRAYDEVLALKEKCDQLEAAHKLNQTLVQTLVRALGLSSGVLVELTLLDTEFSWLQVEVKDKETGEVQSPCVLDVIEQATYAMELAAGRPSKDPEVDEPPAE